MCFAALEWPKSRLRGVRVAGPSMIDVCALGPGRERRLVAGDGRNYVKKVSKKRSPKRDRMR